MCEKGLALQGTADDFDQVRRQVGDVAHRLVFHLAVFAVGAGQEVGLMHPALILTTSRHHMYGTVSFSHARRPARTSQLVNTVSVYTLGR